MEQTARFSRKLKSWAYIRAALIGFAVGLPLYFCLARWYSPPRLVFTREVVARFEWDSGHGLKMLRLEETLNGKQAGSWLWRYLVAVQEKAYLERDLNKVGWQRINGSADVKVTKIFPFVYPDGLGTDASGIEDPEFTPLMRAADRGNIDSVKRLLAAGAQVNARDQWGETALTHACMRGNSSPGLIRALLAAGVDANASNKSGRTPLLLAVAHPPHEDGIGVVRELLAARADVNARDEGGVTPLMVAAVRGYVDTVDALLAAGADVNARDRKGETALSLAERKNHSGIVKLLKSAGARK